MRPGIILMILAVIVQLLSIAVLVSSVRPEWHSYHSYMMQRARMRPAILTRRRLKVRRSGKFKASSSKCCKIGYRTAKKQLSCNLDLNTFTKRHNMVLYRPVIENQDPVSKRSLHRLTRKIYRCSANYSRYFEKCCKYRRQFIDEFRECKRLRGKKRKFCRDEVRRRYPKARKL